MDSLTLRPTGQHYVQQEQEMTATFCLFQPRAVRSGLMVRGCVVPNPGVSQLPVKACLSSYLDMPVRPVL